MLWILNILVVSIMGSPDALIKAFDDMHEQGFNVFVPSTFGKVYTKLPDIMSVLDPQGTAAFLFVQIVSLAEDGFQVDATTIRNLPVTMFNKYLDTLFNISNRFGIADIENDPIIGAMTDSQVSFFLRNLFRYNINAMIDDITETDNKISVNNIYNYYSHV